MYLGSATQAAALTERNHDLLSYFECPGYAIYPDPYSCKWYFKCTASTTQYIPCNDGLYFIFDAQACDWAANVNCTDSVPPNAVKSSGDFDRPGNRLFPDPANCRMFFRCHDDKAMSWLCADGQAFSPDLGKCAVDPEGKLCPEA